MKYTVSWMFNGITYYLAFTSQSLAYDAMIQLDKKGMNPTIHLVD